MCIDRTKPNRTPLPFLSTRRKLTQDSHFFCLTRQETMRSEYLSLCGEGGWSVGREALSRYGPGGAIPVGVVRASR